jgi:N-methylhydantoinase A
MDIGGTSCDIAFIEEGRALEITEGEVSEYPVAVPMIDITTIGAGGGTVAWIDRGGGLNLGPRSAGADPGPVCYARGGQEVTVTDANLVLGYLNPDYFLGGRLQLDKQAAARAIQENVAAPLKLSLTKAALAIVQIIDIRMADRIRVLASQRALALTGFTLMAGGGAGPVHATRVAEELGIQSVLIPPSPGTFSALGLLCTDVVHDYVRSEVSMLAGLDPQRIEAVFAELTDRASDDLRSEGLGQEVATFLREFDLRYAGQGYEVRVPMPAGRVTAEVKATVAELFHEMHERLRGHRASEEPLEVVSYRVRAEVTVPQFQPRDLATVVDGEGTRPAKGAQKGRRSVQFPVENEPLDTPIWQRDQLRSGDTIEGPAVIEQVDATTVLPPAWHCVVDRHGNLRLSRNTA